MDINKRGNHSSAPHEQSSIIKKVGSTNPTSPPHNNQSNFSAKLQNFFGVRPTNPNYKHKKRIFVIATFAFLMLVVIAFLSIGGTITANVIKNKNSLEQQLNSSIQEYEEQLSNKEQEIILAEAEKSSVTSQLADKDSQISELTNEIKSKESQLIDLEKNITSLKQNQSESNSKISNLEDQRDEFLNVIKTSVRDLCCSLSNIQSNSLLEWGVKNDKISCQETEFEINCGTGEVFGYK